MDKQLHKVASASLHTSDYRAFSDYYSTLTGPSKVRYRENIKLIGFDPYMLKNSECSENIAHYPAITYPVYSQLLSDPNLVENRQRDEGLEVHGSLQLLRFWMGEKYIHQRGCRDR